MTNQVVVVGMGQLGTLFAEGFLRSGLTVTPVLRGDDISGICAKTKPDAVLIATGEDDLDGALGSLPPFARDRVILIQNELRPENWQKHRIEPTIAVVWFEKKQGKPPTVVLPTVLFGEHTALLDQALEKLALPRRAIESREELAHELVLKNLYILALNLTGLRVGGVAQDLLTTHKTLFRSVVVELLALEAALLNETAISEDPTLPNGAAHSFGSLDKARLLKDLEGAILADPQHSCSGRSAPRRLARTLENAARLGMETPILTELARELK